MYFLFAVDFGTLLLRSDSVDYGNCHAKVAETSKGGVGTGAGAVETRQEEWGDVSALHR